MKNSIWKRSNLIRCFNCSEMVDIRAELESARRATKKQIYAKIVDKWADSAEIKLSEIKRIINGT